jgi:hypothetical protein
MRTLSLKETLRRDGHVFAPDDFRVLQRKQLGHISIVTRSPPAVSSDLLRATFELVLERGGKE